MLRVLDRRCPVTFLLITTPVDLAEACRVE